MFFPDKTRESISLRVRDEAMRLEVHETAGLMDVSSIYLFYSLLFKCYYLFNTP